MIENTLVFLVDYLILAVEILDLADLAQKLLPYNLNAQNKKLNPKANHNMSKMGKAAKLEFPTVFHLYKTFLKQ